MYLYQELFLDEQRQLLPDAALNKLIYKRRRVRLWEIPLREARGVI